MDTEGTAVQWELAAVDFLAAVGQPAVEELVEISRKSIVGAVLAAKVEFGVGDGTFVVQVFGI